MAGGREAVAAGISSLKNTHPVGVWKHCWENGITPWIEEGGNRPMWEYMNAEYLKNLSKSPSDMKVFVPMCGASKDMIMLYELGFTVVGVEYVGGVIEKFFKEHQIPKQEKPSETWISASHVPTISKDGRLIILEGDLLKCTQDSLPFPQYDLIWDRAAFGSINVNDREEYACLMLRILASDGILLIDTYELGNKLYGGPPTHVGREGLLKHYGTGCSIVEVNRHDVLQPDHPKRGIMLKKGLTTSTYEVINVIKKLH